MKANSQSESTLLQLPSEIRHQIWQLVFSDHHVILSRSGPQLAQDGCRACIDTVCKNASTGTSTSDFPSWVEVVRPLRTCKQIFNEAKEILLSSITLHLGSPLVDPLPHSVLQPLATMKYHVRRVEWRVHITGDNRLDWGSSIPSIGNLFPNLEKVTIHAHMRPPNSYEVLIDAVYVALPLVRLGKREMPNLQISLDLAYTFSGLMFESPFLGDVTTEDAMDEHELVIREVMDDEEFVELALGPEQETAVEREMDIQDMTSAMIRCARVHEQAWFEKLHRKRQTKLSEMAPENPGLEASQSEETGQI